MRLIRKKRNHKNRPSRACMKRFLAVRRQLKRALVHERARGRRCWLDKGTSLLGPGIVFENKSLRVASPFKMMPRVVRRVPKPRKPAFPKLIVGGAQRVRLLKGKLHVRRGATIRHLNWAHSQRG